MWVGVGLFWIGWPKVPVEGWHLDRYLHEMEAEVIWGTGCQIQLRTQEKKKGRNDNKFNQKEAIDDFNKDNFSELVGRQIGKNWNGHEVRTWEQSADNISSTFSAQEGRNVERRPKWARRFRRFCLVFQVRTNLECLFVNGKKSRIKSSFQGNIINWCSDE